MTPMKKEKPPNSPPPKKHAERYANISPHEKTH